jgi:hypothetical protein
MFRDPLIRKAWALCKETEQCPTEIILKATIWLEEKYQQAPDSNTAAVIALHYLMLTMRQDPRITADIAKDYFSRAARWREEAGRCATQWHLLAVPQNRN